ncbi:unnamed protein product [Allacma fusca]|uniref:Peptidase S1 domain-containing protein n=1 Tax=Allacma fusca TaxID=39272 RepID=A0A8J2JHH9_9HEXA|nr:unnamed protein product [Allacma fusca]
MKLTIFLGFLVLIASPGLHGRFTKDESTAAGFLPPRGRNHGILPLVIGGKDAAKGQYPHQVSLQVKYYGSWYHICGGNLIAEDKVLTAAHCVDNSEYEEFRIVAGDWDLTQIDGTEQYSSISRISMHPNYDDWVTDYDYAVLTLSTPLELNLSVGVIGLASSDDFVPPGNCSISGWGLIDNHNSKVHPILQTANMPLVPHSVCKEKHEKINNVTERMVCAGADGVGACFGDSGGPLQCVVATNNNTLTLQLVGITSWGVFPCAQEQYPTVFADVAFCRSWIESQ